MLEDQSTAGSIWATIGGALAMLATGALGWIARKKTREADDAHLEARVAEHETEEESSRVTRRTLGMLEQRILALNHRLDAAETEMKVLRDKNQEQAIELAAVKMWARFVVDMLRRNGLEPPPLEGIT